MGRTIRILGLHGFGTSGSIFESQTGMSLKSRDELKLTVCCCTATFRKYLQPQSDSDDRFEFHFANGPFPSGPAAGISLFYNPPYYCFWRQDGTLDDIAIARSWLQDYLKRHGPFDGVIMFSQGCSLGSSTLLHHCKDSPSDPPPFKFAIFVCGGPVLQDLDQRLGFTIPEEVWALEQAARRALSQRADTAAILKHGSERWHNDLHELTDLSAQELADMLSGPYRINIPTVHIVGARDPRNFAGYQLHALSHPDARKMYEHPGGHDIPRDGSTSTTIANLVRWVSSSLVASKFGGE